MKRIILLICMFMLFVSQAYAAETEQDFYPKNVNTFGTNGKLVISWLNPSSSKLKAIKIYEVNSDGDEVELNGVSQDAGAAVHFALSGRIVGSLYKFRIDSSFTGHDMTSFDFAVEFNEDAMPSVTSWGCERNLGQLSYCPVITYVDINDAHSGNAALRVIGNTTVPGNNYVSYTQKLNLDAEKKYQLSFWAKGNSGGIGCFNNWAQFDNNSSYWNFNPAGEMKDWEQRKITLTNPQNNTLRIILERKSDYFMLDDFEMYELDENGEPVGDNLIVNGSFEEGVSESSAPNGINTVTVGTDEYEIVSLTWDALSNTSQKVNIYRKFNGEYVKIAVFPGSVTSYDVRGLMTDAENDLAISVTGTNYIESELYCFNAEPVSRPIIIGDTRMYRGNTNFTNLVRGTMTIENQIKNNRMGDSFSAELIVALYKNGELVKIWAGNPQIIPQTDSNEEPVSIQKRISIPNLDDGDYHLEIFLWDNYETMKVLKNMVLLNEAAE